MLNGKNLKTYKKGFRAFLEKAIEIHNNRYDYVEESYIKSTANMTIICPSHGEFEQRPDCHTNLKQGCPKCALDARGKKVNDSYKDQLENIFKDSDYNYSFDGNLKLKSLITIHPPTGESYTRSLKTILKSGFIKAIKTNPVFEEQFYVKANQKHNNKYDYSLANYRGAFQTITIICPIHGEFYQKPRDHIQGNGCQKCGSDLVINKKLITKEKFFSSIKNKYLDLDYSKVNYIDYNTDIIITCLHHGDYLQKPSNHVRYKGCEECVKDNTKESLKLTQEEFNKRVSTLNPLYTIVSNNYTSVKSIVKVSCSLHGMFKAKAFNLLYSKSNNCPKCKSISTSNLEKQVRNFLDSLGLEYEVNIRPSWLTGDFNVAQELDLFIPSLNLGIECNGNITHHSTKGLQDFYKNTYKKENYHLNKFQKCKENNINLIHMFEFEDYNEWFNILESYIKNPNNFEISFINNERSFDIKGYRLTYFGQSFITPIK